MTKKEIDKMVDLSNFETIFVYYTMQLEDKEISFLEYQNLFLDTLKELDNNLRTYITKLFLLHSREFEQNGFEDYDDYKNKFRFQLNNIDKVTVVYGLINFKLNDLENLYQVNHIDIDEFYKRLISYVEKIHETLKVDRKTLNENNEDKTTLDEKEERLINNLLLVSFSTLQVGISFLYYQLKTNKIYENEYPLYCSEEIYSNYIDAEERTKFITSTINVYDRENGTLQEKQYIKLYRKKLREKLYGDGERY